MSRGFPRVRGLGTIIQASFCQKIRPKDGSIVEREPSEEPKNSRFQSNWILNNFLLVKVMVILLRYMESLFIPCQDTFYLKSIDICNQNINPESDESEKFFR